MVTCLRLQGGQAQLWQRHQQRGAHRTLHPLVLLRGFRAVQRARVHPLLLQRHCGKTLWGKHEKDGYIVRVISLSLCVVDMNALFLRRVLICPSHHCALSWSAVDHGDEAHAHGYGLVRWIWMYRTITIYSTFSPVISVESERRRTTTVPVRALCNAPYKTCAVLVFKDTQEQFWNRL